MFSLFAKTPATSTRHIGAERSAECATLHASSFAYPWGEADFEQLLAAPETYAGGAVEASESKLAGFVLSRCALDEAEILTLAVEPAWRRNGIGRNLLGSHLAGLAAKGISRVFLEVDEENHAARGLYASFGFRQVAERKAYYRSADARQATALVMRLDMA
ncbi:ribosomal protein S18-alanine N-acetyltransferase [Methylocapsa polymorpha]|uniref:Ribosomal protein S18-alanine N-acetyltransferase n=1 Tax=Methylocapsa polymorpha TaxID=3080828 RepID=A0ABZ0HVE8_9HYPH|nr:ribosomal protein S18-alanine N-acetyltransferase [Methylocapsa sp. RX1]